METEGGAGTDPSARLQADIEQWSQSLGAIKPGSQPQIKEGSWATVAAWSLQFANEPKVLHAFITTDRSSAICHVRMQTGFKAAFTIQGAFQRCTSELKAAARGNVASANPNTQSTDSLAGVTGSGKSSSSAVSAAKKNTTRRPGSPPPPASADQTPSHPENWNNVADVLFQSSYSTGVGGMVVMEYEPLVLFKDGAYFELADQALEDIDLAAERAARPVHWGTWKMQGNKYIFTDNKGRSHDHEMQQGSLFKAFPAEAGGPLNLKYKRVSGGGNSALGGEISILVESRMTFTADGRFGSGSDVAMTGSGDQSGVSMAGGASKRRGVGSYRIHHHTIELRYPDGHSERRFFAYASSHTPARIDRELIFISDSPYVHDD